MTHQTGMTNDDQCRRSSFGCHVADGNVAPDSVRERSFGFVGVRGRSLSLYLVVGVGRRVVVVVGSVVVWWLWWLMEERKYVTHCDISVMFKLTREIT